MPHICCEYLQKRIFMIIKSIIFITQCLRPPYLYLQYTEQYICHIVIYTRIYIYIYLYASELFKHFALFRLQDESHVVDIAEGYPHIGAVPQVADIHAAAAGAPHTAGCGKVGAPPKRKNFVLPGNYNLFLTCSVI